MKKTFFTFVLFMFAFGLSNVSFSQIKLQEGFEGLDTIPGSLPQGWSVFYNTLWGTEPTYNWMVRDSGRSMPGLATARTKSHSGTKSLAASWWASVDTTGGSGDSLTDCWVVTKRINVSSGDSLRFFMSGGSPTYWDSVQVWVGIIDSLPENFLIFPTNRLGTVIFPGASGGGSVYGSFVRKAYYLGNFAASGPIWIAFRYYTNVSIDGFAVYLDDVMIGGPNVGITQTNSNIPDKFALQQNYPNPFNPTTNIRFSLPKATDVKIVIFNSMGQEVKTLVSEFKNAGSYSVDFNASELASGTYFYKLITSDFTETKKMTLVK
ncbi:MAG: T9SS type A sorting domain-containing protein [Ignavibacteria bacterium]|nr:T9SS type A sorting domain-containing protein [Ignavibacteria bacterium]